MTTPVMFNVVKKECEAITLQAWESVCVLERPSLLQVSVFPVCMERNSSLEFAQIMSYI